MSRTETNNLYFLLTNQTTDVNGDAVQVNYPNKKAIVKATGTFDGATIKFQSLAPQRPSATWIDIPDQNGAVVTLSTAGQRPLEYFVQNEQMRAVLTSAGGSTDITVTLEII